MTPNIEQLFNQIYKLPQVPEVVRTLMLQINNPDIEMEAIARNVAKDQVISLKVLRLVNSAYFGLSRKIGSINEAVVVIGMNKLKTLVIASGLVESVPDIANFDVKSFWTHSFRTATYAQWLATQTTIESEDDVLFTAGLIGGLGTILIYLGAASEAHEIEQHVTAGNSRLIVEQRRLGFTSLDVCAELCRRWKFPEQLVTTIEQSGQPLKFEQVSQQACIVNLARYLSECCASKLREEDILRTLPEKVLEKLPVSRQEMSEMLPEILALESGLEGLLE